MWFHLHEFQEKAKLIYGYKNQKVVVSGRGRNGQEKGCKGTFWDYTDVFGEKVLCVIAQTLWTKHFRSSFLLYVNYTSIKNLKFILQKS